MTGGNGEWKQGFQGIRKLVREGRKVQNDVIHGFKWLSD